jgi:nitric oxide reductase NorE protein
MNAVEAPPVGAGEDGLTKRHVPGEPGVWVFVLGDMTVFALLFAVFTFYFGRSEALFTQAQASLDLRLGLLNTVLLLTSSWFVAAGVEATRNTGKLSPAGCLAGAFVCGAGFVAVKAIEWGEKLAAGIGPHTNDFFMYFFLLTGIHLAHVLIGLAVLAFMWRAVRRARGTRTLMEGGATYWHMVDLLWVVLFALLYLKK